MVIYFLVVGLRKYFINDTHTHMYPLIHTHIHTHTHTTFMLHSLSFITCMHPQPLAPLSTFALFRLQPLCLLRSCSLANMPLEQAALLAAQTF